MASLTGTPDSPLYGAAKHGVLGLYRALRVKSLFGSEDRNKTKHNGRINVHCLCPYFTDTPILKGEDGVRRLPMSTQLTKIEDVIESATRLITSKSGGHALCVTTPQWAKGRGKGGIFELREIRSKL